MSRQRKRHLNRMPLDEQVRLAVADRVQGALSVRVEVINHDGIHDILVYVELTRATPSWQVEEWLKVVGRFLHDFQVANPHEPCLASWSVFFEEGDQQVTHTFAHEYRAVHAA